MNRRPTRNRTRKMKRRELIHALRTREDHAHELLQHVSRLSEQVVRLKSCAVMPGDVAPVTDYDERTIEKRMTTLDVMCDRAGYPEPTYLAGATKHAAKLFANDLVERNLIEVTIPPHQPRRDRAEVVFTIHIAKPNRRG